MSLTHHSPFITQEDGKHNNYCHDTASASWIWGKTIVCYFLVTWYKLSHWGWLFRTYMPQRRHVSLQHVSIDYNTGWNHTRNLVVKKLQLSTLSTCYWDVSKDSLRSSDPASSTAPQTYASVDQIWKLHKVLFDISLYRVGSSFRWLKTAWA